MRIGKRGSDLKTEARDNCAARHLDLAKRPSADYDCGFGAKSNRVGVSNLFGEGTRS